VINLVGVGQVLASGAIDFDVDHGVLEIFECGLKLPTGKARPPAQIVGGDRAMGTQVSVREQPYGVVFVYRADVRDRRTVGR
jgi:hypothetical protein